MVEDIEFVGRNLPPSLVVVGFLISWAVEILEASANFAEDIDSRVATLPSLLTLVVELFLSAAESLRGAVVRNGQDARELFLYMAVLVGQYVAAALSRAALGIAE